MKGQVARLMEVKSIVTIGMTAALIVLLVGNFNPSKELLTMFSTAYGAIITYFFTRKSPETGKKEP